MYAGSMSGTITLNTISIDNLAFVDSSDIMWYLRNGQVIDVASGENMNRYTVEGSVITLSTATVEGPLFVRLVVL